MLVEFTVANFRSIRGAQTLSMVPTADAEHERDHVTRAPAPSVPRLLKTAVVYGANGAGKSNLINALSCMALVVNASASSEFGPDSNLPIVPFLFDDSESEPSTFRLVFVVDGAKYELGFIASSEKIFEEWLIAYPVRHAQEWYRRKLTSSGAYEWSFSPYFKGQKQVWKNATRSNGLFLSTAINLNCEQLLPVYRWFKSQLRIIASGEVREDVTKRSIKAGRSEEIVSFLKSFDAFVEELSVEEEPIDKRVADLIAHIPDESIRKRFEFDESASVSVKHIGKNGKEIWLDLGEESRGTAKLFAFAVPLLETLEKGYVLVIDELNNGLHPLLVKRLVEMFNAGANRSNAQLIFASHAASILTLDLFRRDEIWFAEKNSDGATEIYSLAEFSPRKSASIAKGYLQGRYGAVPVLGPSIELPE